MIARRCAIEGCERVHYAGAECGMSILKARLVWPHLELSEDTYHEWVITGEFVGDSRGVSHPGMTYANWFKVECNNAGCGGWGVVNKEAVTHLLDEVTS